MNIKGLFCRLWISLAFSEDHSPPNLDLSFGYLCVFPCRESGKSADLLFRVVSRRETTERRQWAVYFPSGTVVPNHPQIYDTPYYIPTRNENRCTPGWRCWHTYPPYSTAKHLFAIVRQRSVCIMRRQVISCVSILGSASVFPEIPGACLHGVFDSRHLLNHRKTTVNRSRKIL